MAHETTLACASPRLIMKCTCDGTITKIKTKLLWNNKRFVFFVAGMEYRKKQYKRDWKKTKKNKTKLMWNVFSRPKNTNFHFNCPQINLFFCGAVGQRAGQQWKRKINAKINFLGQLFRHGIIFQFADPRMDKRNDRNEQNEQLNGLKF